MHEAIVTACSAFRRCAAFRPWLTRLVSVAALAFASSAIADTDLTHRALAIEATLYGYPQRSLEELSALAPR